MAQGGTMIRRRRRVREIPFSFDSFLDIVANVVGIIIRLILVVWVGARSYSSVQHLAVGSKPSTEATPPALPEVADPLQRELAQHRRELDEAQERLLEQLRQFQQVQQKAPSTESALAALGARRQRLEQEQQTLGQAKGKHATTVRAVALTSDELRKRSQKLAEEIKALEQQPPPKKVLHYRTPVSRPVQSDELLFECNRGRVTFIDIGGLLGEVRPGMEDKGKQLRTQWEVSDVTGTVGAFRLHYTVERERGLLDSLGGAGTPETNGGYRYGVSAWFIEPIAFTRGETVEAALAADSEFRQIVDGLDPQQTTVTFWVYPDSFALFRQLRDYLYERDIVVAVRPLPDGVPIASSRRGTVSRGQ
jgi:hypothetical protein